MTEGIEPSCAVEEIYSLVDTGPVLHAAFDAVRTWITTGKTAPPSIYFNRTSSGLVRDANGNSKGGIRLPELVAPTARNTPLNGTAFPCFVSGSHQSYTAEELTALYGSHGKYVSEVSQCR